ncbi:hypothetical protein FH608_002685 [Nonomuraea phyllanthi]|uniref:Uncharacterized protein n=1 Tax=Nonomuraea phyllanthi TaxID=2219224 RepID=A0A5C4WV47_9ACTN|nr:hypothetical protein [Nonomuraea phyllanthi]KAB8197478.1 hypothetical protein FH608_002685 [Nonomuraea phyllanthi]QFY06529.1 hypothetical protein GBF35_07390 [Nonomuraea phyllanthi]
MRLRAWLASGAVVAAGLLAAQPATAAASVPFHADSGDQCLRGVAEGTLEWVDGPIVRPVVRVDGALTDEASVSPCAHDGLYSTVTFSGYSGKSLVDSEVAKADNEKVALSFTLSNPDAFIPVDRVVVQVCRYSTTPVGTSYCGKAVEYTAS